jgi:hypothetical protein
MINYFCKQKEEILAEVPSDKKPWVFKCMRITFVKNKHDVKETAVHTCVVPLANLHFVFDDSRSSLLVEGTDLISFVPPLFSTSDSVVLLASNDPFLEHATDTISLGQSFLWIHLDNVEITSLSPLRVKFHIQDMDIKTGVPQR